MIFRRCALCEEFAWTEEDGLCPKCRDVVESEFACDDEPCDDEYCDDELWENELFYDIMKRSNAHKN
jgi:hypothetical protein